jgi:hypothetical protein
MAEFEPGAAIYRSTGDISQYDIIARQPLPADGTMMHG